MFKKTEELKSKIKQGSKLDDLLPEAFALVREASKRVNNEKHFDVQIVGGAVLHQNKIAEIVNTIAPEHLEINFRNYKNILKMIKNAGSIFIGKFSMPTLRARTVQLST